VFKVLPMGIPESYKGQNTDRLLFAENTIPWNKPITLNVNRKHPETRHHINEEPVAVFGISKMQDNSTELSDIDTVYQVMNGNIDAFESLIERHKDVVLRIVKRHVPYNEIEDVVQNAFLRVYQSLSKFKGKGKFRNWICSITVRTCYDYWRKAYKNCEIPMSALTEEHQKWLDDVISIQSEAEIHEKAQEKQASELLEWALGKLSPKDRMIVELVYLENLSGRETAELLGWTVSNVKVRSFRAKGKLKSLLKKAMKK
jgi:RNA polymerase sigma-70 factor (ECF subfamily)